MTPALAPATGRAGQPRHPGRWRTAWRLVQRLGEFRRPSRIVRRWRMHETAKRLVGNAAACFGTVSALSAFGIGYGTSLFSAVPGPSAACSWWAAGLAPSPNHHHDRKRRRRPAAGQRRKTIDPSA